MSLILAYFLGLGLVVLSAISFTLTLATLDCSKSVMAELKQQAKSRSTLTTVLGLLLYPISIPYKIIRLFPKAYNKLKESLND